MSTLLMVGDIHLGRVPARLASADLDPRTLSPVEAWRRLVEAAIEQSVDAVVLAGDVVDDERDRFEAYGHLHQGVTKLTRAGVQVFGVAGNHDGIALPRLAERIDAFRLLGRGGTWELARLPGSQAVDLLGWSFPSRHHRQSPLRSPGLDAQLARRRDGAACLGVLHGDLDAGSSLYAPVARAELEQLELDGWFLGHIHAPSLSVGGRPLGYLGSLVGLDRGESGPRGPWCVQVEGRGRVDARQWNLGPLRWLDLVIAVDELPDDDGADDYLHQRVVAAFSEQREGDVGLSDPALKVIACSIRFVGRPRAPYRVAEFVAKLDPLETVLHLDEQTWLAVKMVDDSRPRVDLDQLARQQTPVGLVARLLRDVEGGGVIPEEVRACIAPRDRPLLGADWNPDAARWPPAAERELVLTAARRLLDSLLAQRTGGGGS